MSQVQETKVCGFRKFVQEANQKTASSREIRRPKSEGRTKSEGRNPNKSWLGSRWINSVVRWGGFSYASVALLVVPGGRAATIAEDFSSNPLQHGWQVFGDTNLFRWDGTNRQLAVTWDSTKPNSYFHHPLPWYLTRNDDFKVEFDLNLSDIASGVEAGKTGPLQLGFGFLDFAGATSTNFMRGSFGDAPNVAEFDYYAHGYYTFGETIYDSPAATTPAFISGINSFDYAPALISVYDNELPTNLSAHVAFSFNASNQTAAVTVTTTNGPLGQLPDMVLNTTNNFQASDDFHADTFSISSYSSAGDDFDSVLAHGAVANVVVTLPPPAQNLRAGFVNGAGQVQFSDRLNWNYTLERTTNWVSWGAVSAPVAGNGTNLTLLDTNSPVGQAFYRVSARRP